VPTTALGFAAPSEVEQTSPALSFGWRTAENRRAHGRSYAVERSAGASASFTFSGRSVTWFTAVGPAQGRAAVWVDGRRIETFDQYASSPGYRVARGVTGLARGTHTITVRVLGQASPNATDTQVVVDAFETGGDLVANPALDATWGTVRATRASGGSVAASDLGRASVELTFRGTCVVWTTVRDRDQGRAAIYVDGMLVRTVDNYAPTRMFGVERTVSGLADGVHTLRIVVLGESRPAANGAFVSIDRFAALP
jgi:hypothetical protein